MLAGQAFALWSLGVVGGVVLVHGIRDIVYAIASTNWPMTSGCIISTEYHEDPNQLKDSFYITYEYRIQGTLYIGRKIQIAQFGNRARQWSKKYFQAAAVDVYVHPRRPRLAVLEPGVDSWFRYLWFPLLGLVFICLTIIFRFIM